MAKSNDTQDRYDTDAAEYSNQSAVFNKMKEKELERPQEDSPQNHSQRRFRSSTLKVVGGRERGYR